MRPTASYIKLMLPFDLYTTRWLIVCGGSRGWRWVDESRFFQGSGSRFVLILLFSSFFRWQGCCWCSRECWDKQRIICPASRSVRLGFLASFWHWRGLLHYFFSTFRCTSYRADRNVEFGFRERPLWWCLLYSKSAALGTVRSCWGCRIRLGYRLRDRCCVYDFPQEYGWVLVVTSLDMLFGTMLQ